MAFYRASGTANCQMLPGAASTALTANALVTVTAGALALVASTGNYAIGICKETRASTDADYATARGVLVDMVSMEDVLLCDSVVTAALTTAMVGQFFKLSSTTGISADGNTATDTPANGLILVCVGFISTTQGYFVLSASKLNRAASAA